MTCIVGIETEDGAWLGADSFVGGGEYRMPHAGLKLAPLTACGSVVMAVTGRIRFLQVVKHDVVLPREEAGETPERWVHRFVRSMRQALEAEGALHRTDNEDQSTGAETSAILCCRGRLFEIHADFAVLPASTWGYMADGAGYKYALGALHATQGMPSEERVRRALAAAAEHCPMVAPPFNVCFVPRSP